MCLCSECLRNAHTSVQIAAPAPTGWNCWRCGGFIPNGCTHDCPTHVVPWPTTPPTNVRITFPA